MEQVIVYRSRTEAELDKLIWDSNGSFFEVGMFCVLYLGTFLALNSILTDLLRKYCRKNGRSKITEFIYRHFILIIGLVSLPATYGVGKLLKYVFFQSNLI